MTIKVERVDEDVWQLLENYTSPVCPDVTVPRGFMFDGATIPDFVKSFIANDDFGVLEAACTHDFLYSNESLFTRSQVDKIFYHELMYYGLNTFKSYMAFRAVRIFGGSHWQQQ